MGHGGSCDCNQVKWIETNPDDPSDSLPNLIDQYDSDSETSDCPPPVLVPEGGNATAQHYAGDESIVPLNAPDEGAPPKIPFVESDDALVASDDASVADSYSSNEPNSKYLHQSNKLGNANLAISIKPTKSPVPLDPSRFQFVLPNSPERNSRVNNAIGIVMRLVILC